MMSGMLTPIPISGIKAHIQGVKEVAWKILKNIGSATCSQIFTYRENVINFIKNFLQSSDPAKWEIFSVYVVALFRKAGPVASSYLGTHFERGLYRHAAALFYEKIKYTNTQVTPLFSRLFAFVLNYIADKRDCLWISKELVRIWN